MKIMKEKLPMTDGEEVVLHAWLPDVPPTYVVVVCHGMNEFAERYMEFGSFLCVNGIALYAHDQRGHGETAVGSSNLGFLAHSCGFDRVVDDLRAVLETVASRHSGVKLFLLGHSFGSFVSQGYMERYGKQRIISGCLLSGTVGPRPCLVFMARIVARSIRMVRGGHYRSRLMKWMVFGSYNSKIENPESEHAWLTRDTESVCEYEKNLQCTFVPTISFFCDLFDGLSSIHTSRMMLAIPKNLPVFLFFGSKDPVGDYGKSPRRLYAAYRKMGLKYVTFHEYEEGRHEMLFETNRKEVMSDLLSVLNRWNDGILSDM